MRKIARALAASTAAAISVFWALTASAQSVVDQKGKSVGQIVTPYTDGILVTRKMDASNYAYFYITEDGFMDERGGINRFYTTSNCSGAAYYYDNGEWVGIIGPGMFVSETKAPKNSTRGTMWYLSTKAEVKTLRSVYGEFGCEPAMARDIKVRPLLSVDTRKWGLTAPFRME
jgi:hypothetical protein